MAMMMRTALWLLVLAIPRHAGAFGIFSTLSWSPSKLSANERSQGGRGGTGNDERRCDLSWFPPRSPALASRRLTGGTRLGETSPALSSTNTEQEIRQHDQYHPRMGELTPPEARVYELLNEIRSAGFAFRIVVAGGRGAISEFTVPSMGPRLSISQSPSTGSNLLTLASDDATWEFHVQLSNVFKIALVEKQTPAKTLRIVRLIGATGDTITSLILVPDFKKATGDADGSGEAIEWFHGLVEKYGSEVQL